MGDKTQVNDVHKVKMTKPRNKDGRNKSTHVERTTRKYDTEHSTTYKACGYCGRKHKSGRESWPAWEETCKACGKRNYFAKQCKQGKGSTNHHVTEADSSDSDYIESVTVKPKQSTP